MKRFNGMTQGKERLIRLFFLCVFFFTARSSAQFQIPAITDPVTDLTATLSTEEQQMLRQRILEFERSTSNQIVVLIVPSLNGDDIRETGIKTLEKNKIGQQGKDNGVLLFIAREDKQVSIEVGYGLEGALTDALCDRIIRNEIRPRFREGNYAGGITAAIEAITAAVQGEYTGEKSSKKKKSDWFPVLFIFLIILVSILGASRGSRSSISSRGARNMWWGGGGGFGGGGFGSFGGGGGGGGWSAGGGSFGGGGASGSW